MTSCETCFQIITKKGAGPPRFDFEFQTNLISNYSKYAFFSRLEQNENGILGSVSERGAPSFKHFNSIDRKSSREADLLSPTALARTLSLGCDQKVKVEEVNLLECENQPEMLRSRKFFVSKNVPTNYVNQTTMMTTQAQRQTMKRICFSRRVVKLLRIDRQKV